MENHHHHRHTPASAIGFCLLPSELIENILLRLLLPEIITLKSLNKSIADIISDPCFIREYNSRSRSTTWLFVYKKRWYRDSVLRGFTDQSSRWFKIQISDLLRPMTCPGESVYFLAASGDVFLFVSNTRQQVLAVNLVTRTVKTLPPSPLGPRGTSSWRRSGMKLVSVVSGHFRFMFAELVKGRPVLFLYESLTEKWRSVEAREDESGVESPPVKQREADCMFLNVVNGAYESVIVAVQLEREAPFVVRPRFRDRRQDEQQLTVGVSWGNVIDRLHVYGDGYMMIIKSKGVNDASMGLRAISGIELWGLGRSGSRDWECISEVPGDILQEIKKPYRAMMGCLEGKDGVIRAALLSNFDGLWDIIWLSYDRAGGKWTWVPLPDCKMKGLNMAGIAFSSGLTLS